MVIRQEKGVLDSTLKPLLLQYDARTITGLDYPPTEHELKYTNSEELRDPIWAIVFIYYCRAIFNVFHSCAVCSARSDITAPFPPKELLQVSSSIRKKGVRVRICCAFFVFAFSRCAMRPELFRLIKHKPTTTHSQS